jgi:hypothetical protein
LLAVLATIIIPGARAGSGAESPAPTHVDGWACQTHESSRAFVRVERAADPANPANQVLKVTCNFDPERRVENQGGLGNGEVIRALRPEDLRKGPAPAPADLKGCTLRCRVYVEKGAMGLSSAPNGVQLLMKSSGYHNWYSFWENIPSEGRWFEVSGRPPEGAFKDQEFDLASVILLGVKAGLNEGADSPFRGVIYLDDFQVIGPDGQVVARWDFEPRTVDIK